MIEHLFWMGVIAIIAMGVIVIYGVLEQRAIARKGQK